MTRFSAFAIAAAMSVWGAAAAQAGVNKTWVSGTGVDSGTCTYAAPCATLQYAHDQANVEGEIDIKDLGGYGTLNINKSINVVAADGVLATINVPQNGIGVNVYAPSGKVLIRGLVINGHGNYGTTTNTTVGINVGGVSSITIEKCTITNLAEGLNLSAGSMFVIGNTLSNNQNALDAGANSSIIIGNNVITGNYYGVQVGIGTVFTYGDNNINGNNLGDVRGSMTYASKN